MGALKRALATLLEAGLVLLGLGVMAFLVILVTLVSARVGLSWLWNRAAQDHAGARYFPRLAREDRSFLRVLHDLKSPIAADDVRLAFWLSLVVVILIAVWTFFLT